MTRILWPALVAATLLAAPASAATFTVSLESEAPGLQNSTSGFRFVGVENFNGRSTGTGQNFTTNFGGSIFSGSYTGAEIRNADQYGGAGGTGQYAVTFNNDGYRLDLSTADPRGVTYFGFWLSALDGGNDVTFFDGQTQLFSFTAATARNFINGLPSSSSYFCNPNAAFANQNCGEPYAFLNFYARGATKFTSVVFQQRTGGGYESDNHTVGQWTRISGTIIPPVGGVPEPSSWAMLIMGFGLTGAAMRRRQRRVVAA